MSIFSHNVYDNIRTRVIVLHRGALLLLPPFGADSAWTLPGGGLEPNESISECAEREVFEESGVRVQVASIAFLREWVVPKYCLMPGGEDRIGFGLEVFLYAHPLDEETELRAETATVGAPRWIPWSEIAQLPLWPKELKALAANLLAGSAVHGVQSFVSQLDSPWASPGEITFSPRVDAR